MLNFDNIRVTRDAIRALFGSQMAAARRLHFHDRTVRWWCQHGAPPHVLATLARLQRGEITLRWARKLMRSNRTRRANGGHQ